MRKQVLLHTVAAKAQRVRIVQHSNELSVVDLDGSDYEYDRDLGGLGTLFFKTVASVKDIVPFVSWSDQTVTYAGVDRGELADALGVDRIVPCGEALALSRYWDGHDLLMAMTRVVEVR